MLRSIASPELEEKQSNWLEPKSSSLLGSGSCARKDLETTPLAKSPAIPTSNACDIAPDNDVAAALLYGLELLQRGAMLVQSDLMPCLANRRAAEILGRREGLALTRCGIAAERASDTRLLTELLQEAMAFPQRGEPKGSPLPLSRRDGAAAMVIRVLPGPDLACWPSNKAKTALMTISNPDQKALVSEQELTRLYGLTRGEAALATRMIQGKSLEGAAAELFISAHTARTHLKRIFLKTETHRQSELVALLLTNAW